MDGNVSVAMFQNPRGIAVDGAGVIWVADSGNNALRRISTTGVVSTLAGGLSVFNNPRGVAVGTGGTLYVADYGNQRIAQVTSAGVVSTYAGTYTTGSIGGTVGYVNATGTAAQFYNPVGVARASNGVLYVTDSGNNAIRAISTARVVTTYAGPDGSGDHRRQHRRPLHRRALQRPARHRPRRRQQRLHRRPGQQHDPSQRHDGVHDHGDGGGRRHDRAERRHGRGVRR